MSSAEQLLHEAQYAFASISFGESLSNTRNALKAKSLCRKLIRRFPGTMEADEARAILRRLGEEAYTSELPVRHRHASRQEHRETPALSRAAARPARNSGAGEMLNWAGLVGLLFGVPKAVLFIIIAVGFVLFSIFGPFLVLPLIALVLLTGPFRSLLKPDARRQLNEFVVRVNALIDERRGSGKRYS